MLDLGIDLGLSGDIFGINGMSLTPGTISRMTSASRNERPGENLVRTSSSSAALMSFSRTMMLFTPRSWYLAMASRLAPSPMESMAITEATPKMIPSIVRNERNLWSVKPWRATLIFSLYSMFFFRV